MFKIEVVSETLSDGSKVFDIVVEDVDDDMHGIWVPMIDEASAYAFKEGLEKLLSDFAV